MIDRRLPYILVYMQYKSEKAAEIGKSLARLLPNFVGRRQERGKLTAEVVTATTLYRSSVWKKALDVPPYARGIQTAYQLCALMVCTVYRTVSEDAALFIDGMVSINLRAKEDKYAAELHC